MNRARPSFPLSFLAILALGPNAFTAPLNLVPVASPAFNCLFDLTCTISGVEDSIGTFTLPGTTGEARLQTRTFQGQPGSRLEGLYAYEYRLDLSNVLPLPPQPGDPDTNCVLALSLVALDPITTYDLNLDGDPGDQAFVITSGGAGALGPTTALRDGVLIQFIFNPNLCPQQQSFFFGLVSPLAPIETTALVSHLQTHLDSFPVPVTARTPGASIAGLSHKAVGSVAISTINKQLKISGFPRTGTAGFEVDLGYSQGWSGVVDEAQFGPSGDHSILMTALGAGEDPDLPFAGSARLWVSSGVVNASADFSGFGVETLVVEYRGPNGELVGTHEASNKLPVSLCGLPSCTNGVINSVCEIKFMSYKGEPAAVPQGLA